MNVSVIIPVYNAENFLRRAVESALKHPEVKEVILVEDGSPDNSLNVCKALATEHQRVHLYQHPGDINKGAGATRNLGIQKATQEFICFLDADDFMTDLRFEKEKEIFSLNPAVDGVYGATGAYYDDEVGASAWTKMGFDEKHLDTMNQRISPDDLFEYLIGYKRDDQYPGDFTIDALTIKKGRLIKESIFFDEQLKLHQDSVFIWQCAYYLKLFAGELEKPVAIRGIHKDNRFIHHQNMIDSRLKFYKRLIAWSIEEKLEKEYRELFQTNYYYLSLPNLSVIRTIVLGTNHYLFNKYFRKTFHRFIHKKLGINTTPKG